MTDGILKFVGVEEFINSSLEWPSDVSAAVTRSCFGLYFLQKVGLN